MVKSSANPENNKLLSKLSEDVLQALKITKSISIFTDVMSVVVSKPKSLSFHHMIIPKQAL